MQMAVLFHHLGNPSAAPKGAVPLNEKQVEMLAGMRTRCFGVMAATPPDGRRFQKGVVDILNRENHWNTWKQDGAQALERTLGQPEADLWASHLSGATKHEVHKAKRLRVMEAPPNGAAGYLHLLALDNHEEGGGGAEGAASRRVPAVDKWLGSVKTEMDPDEGVEEEYKRKNDKVYTWRSTRYVVSLSLSLSLSLFLSLSSSSSSSLFALN